MPDLITEMSTCSPSQFRLSTRLRKGESRRKLTHGRQKLQRIKLRSTPSRRLFDEVRFSRDLVVF